MNISTWDDERLAWPTSVKETIRDGDLAMVFQCGGRGRRLRRFAPKPLIALPNGDRPLVNLIQDVAPEVPIFLHGMAEEKDKYLAFLATNNNFFRRISYVDQRYSPLHHDARCSYRIAAADGTQVMGSAGPATFCLDFVRPPRYIFVTDGSKIGLHFADIVAALYQLIHDRDSDMIAFTVALTDDEIQNEMALLDQPGKHPRFARIDPANQKVYEQPDRANAYMVSNEKCPALSGAYVVKTVALMDFVFSHEGIPIEAESIDHLHSGYCKQLKMSMVMRGFAGVSTDSGLKFASFDLHRDEPNQKSRFYFRGIKDAKDVNRYLDDEVATFAIDRRKTRENSLKQSRSATDSPDSLGSLLLVLQCGGRGENLEKLEPEALSILPDHERPVTCLLKDVPAKIPVLLHILMQHKSMYMGLLNRYRYFGHEISYLIQGSAQLFHDNSCTEPCKDSLGVKVLTSDGPGTWIHRIIPTDNRTIALVVDGNKTGIHFEDIKGWVEQFIRDTEHGISVMARRLNSEEIENEKTRLAQGKRPRYARLKTCFVTNISIDSQEIRSQYMRVGESCKIYEPYSADCRSDLIGDVSALAICGIYLVRTSQLDAGWRATRKQPPPTRALSFNGLHEGFARTARMPLLLRGADFLDLPFSIWLVHSDFYLHGVKEEGDFALYEEYQRQGRYNYRKSLDSWR